jgi:hypothetical protein|tara:strand:- start:202 stop:420 length:219 start_codon:yes stop_codon:yes gene_type:complete
MSDQRCNLKESPAIKSFTLSINADFVKDTEAKIMLIKMNGVMNFKPTFLSENKRAVDNKNKKINIKPELEEE